MNRKTLLGLSAALALFAAAPLRADDAPSNFHFGIGYKAWASKWSTWDADNDGNTFSLTKGSIAHIPNVSLRYKQWMFAGSYISTGNFNFPQFSDWDCNSFYPNCYQDVRNYHAKRTEWDVNFGYLLPTRESTSLGLTVGWKNVEQKFKVDGSYNAVAYTPYGFKFGVSGPTIGITGSAAIGNGFALYGNGAGGWMKVKNDPNNRFKTGLYESAELGLAWRKSMIQLSFGYRYQVLETGFKSSDNFGEDVTRGYTFGISFVK